MKTILMMTFLIASAATAQTPRTAKSLTAGRIAPELNALDSLGAPLRLAAFRGRRMYLGLLRSTGCPVCNLRHHELAKVLGTAWAEQVVLVYPSTQAHLAEYQIDQQSPFHLGVDRSGATHAAYGVGKSVGKVLRGTFNGLLRKNAAGQKIYRKPVQDDVSKLQGTADFLIDENGVIVLVHYPRFAGDDLPISTIQQFLAGGSIAK